MTDFLQTFLKPLAIQVLCLTLVPAPSGHRRHRLLRWGAGSEGGRAGSEGGSEVEVVEDGVWQVCMSTNCTLNSALPAICRDPTQLVVEGHEEVG